MLPCSSLDRTTVAWIGPNRSLQYHGYHSQLLSDQEATSLLDRVNNKLRDNWLFQWTIDFTEESLDLVLKAIHHRKAIGVTDGSFKQGKGTAGFCIMSPTTWHASCQIPGQPDVQYSYRSELGGILGLLTILDIMVEEASITNGSLTIGCNNVQAGEHALEWTRFPSPTQDHFDLLQQIHTLRHRQRVEIYYYYVEVIN